MISFDERNFCLNHVVLFRTNGDFKRHLKTCEKQSRPYTCNMLQSDGSMCGEEMLGGTTLYIHCLSEHSTHICTECDYFTRDLDKFSVHICYTKSGRQSKHI